MCIWNLNTTIYWYVSEDMCPGTKVYYRQLFIFWKPKPFYEFTFMHFQKVKTSLYRPKRAFSHFSTNSLFLWVPSLSFQKYTLVYLLNDDVKNILWNVKENIYIYVHNKTLLVEIWFSINTFMRTQPWLF